MADTTGRVLIVDDDVSMLTTLERLLFFAGYDTGPRRQPSPCPIAGRHRLLSAEVAVNRCGAAENLHEVRETPRAAEHRDDDSSERRPIHPPGQSLWRWLRLQRGVTSPAQLARAARGDVPGTAMSRGWPGSHRPACRHDQRSCCKPFLQCRNGGRLAEFLRKCCACLRQALAQRLGTYPAHHRRVGGRQALATDEQDNLPVLR